MFRPIRRDTPRGEAVYRLEFGIELMLVYTPLFLVMYYGEHVLTLLNESGVSTADLFIPPLWLVAVATFLGGIGMAYDGWWHLQRLKPSRGT